LPHTTPCHNVARALHVQLPAALAACEWQALDGGAVLFGGTMKCDGVKRQRMRSEQARQQRASRGRLFAFGALPDTTALAKARGLRVLLQAP